MWVGWNNSRLFTRKRSEKIKRMRERESERCRVRGTGRVNEQRRWGFGMKWMRQHKMKWSSSWNWKSTFIEWRERGRECTFLCKTCYSFSVVCSFGPSSDVDTWLVGLMKVTRERKCKSLEAVHNIHGTKRGRQRERKAASEVTRKNITQDHFLLLLCISVTGAVYSVFSCANRKNRVAFCAFNFHLHS